MSQYRSVGSPEESKPKLRGRVKIRNIFTILVRKATSSAAKVDAWTPLLAAFDYVTGADIT